MSGIVVVEFCLVRAVVRSSYGMNRLGLLGDSILRPDVINLLHISVISAPSWPYGLGVTRQFLRIVKTVGGV